MTIALRYDPDGKAFSPVIRANSKFYGGGRWLSVDVRFKDAAQLDNLIEALTLLREFPSNGYNHVHLQDSHPRAMGAAEVTFWHPSAKREALDKSCLRSARESLLKIVDD